jgi:transposase
MTPISLAAAAVELVEGAGYSQRKAGAMVGLSGVTVHDIVHRHGHWGEVAESALFKQYRNEQKATLEAASRAISAKCLIQVEEKLDKASAYQAAGIYGLLRTHERLDAGEPTSISASLNIQAVASLDKLAAMFGARLVEEQKTIDVSPDQTK